jgi:hypothetical protein
MFNKNDRVLIHSFGDGKSHKGTIRGISVNMAPVVVIYIVELDPNNPWESEFDFITVPTACLTLIGE